MAELMLLVLLMSLSAVVSQHYVGAQVQQSSYQVCDCDPYYSLGCLCVSQGSCDKSKYIVGTIPDLDFEEMDVLTYCRGIEICCRIPAAPQQSTSTRVTNTTTVTPTTSTTTTTTTETPSTVTPTTSTTTTTTAAAETPSTITPTTSTRTTKTTTTETPSTVTPTTSTTTTETPTTSSSTTTSTTTIRTGPAALRIGNNRMLNLDATTPPATPTTTGTTSNSTTSTTSSSSSNYTECGLLRNAAAALPWVAALFKTSQQDGARSFLCPASIVHPSVVMTAGGCLTPVSVNDSLSVVAGLTDAGGADASTTQRQELQVEKVVRSEYFDPSKPEFDFMLLQLVAPFTRSPSVDVVCLPQPDTSLDLGRCLTAGFSAGSSDGTLRQRQTNVVVRNSSVCESKLWDIIGEDFVLPIGMTCAEGPSLCQSTPLTFQEDYGGPVTCPLVPDPTRFVQVGILSKPLSTCGSGGDTDDVPALMTSASFFSPTIQWMLADMVSENYAVHPSYSKNNNGIDSNSNQ